MRVTQKARNRRTDRIPVRIPEPDVRTLRRNPADTPEVEALMDLCFAPGRTALSSYRLREKGSIRSRACADDAQRIRRAGGRHPLLAGADRRSAGPALGPIAVHQAAQGEGLGRI